MRLLFHVALALVANGCGSDSSAPERVTAACGRMVDASCAKFVECKVLANGTVVTAATCEQIRSSSIDRCRTNEGSAVSAGTDAEIDACVQGFEQFQCANLCGQVPQDPAACQKFGPTPNTHTTMCAP